MKNVLLPTDFTVQSLWPIHDIAKNATSEPIIIHLVHLLNVPTSIPDLLSMREAKSYRTVPTQFTEAYQMLANKYSRVIKNITFRIVYGSTPRFLNNFIKANAIDAVYTLTNYTYQYPHAQSINPLPLLAKCKTTLHLLPLQKETYSDYQILSALLQGNDIFETEPAVAAAKPTVTFS